MMSPPTEMTSNILARIPSPSGNKVAIFQQSGSGDTKQQIVEIWSHTQSNSSLEKKQLMHQQGFEDLRPNTITYSTVIDAWSKSGVKGAGDKAETILNKMQEKYEAGDENVKPDIRSFGAVLNCWAKEGNGPRAEAILTHIEQLMHQQGFEHLRPNTIIYSTVIDAWANSRNDIGVTKVEAILDRMKQMKKQGYDNSAPSVITYNSIMSMYQRSKKKDERMLGKSIPSKIHH